MKQRMVVISLIFFGMISLVSGGCASSSPAGAGSSSASPAETGSSTEDSGTSRQMIYVGGVCLSSAGRKAIVSPSADADGQITEVLSSEEKPSADGQANFDCLGVSYTLLADGAASLELADGDILFLADDTVEYEGIYKKKKDLSDDTLTWLDFYDSLSEDERLALSIVPSEFADELRFSSSQPEYDTDSSIAVSAETAEGLPSYIDALTEDELIETENLIQTYFTEETPYYEGVDQLYPVDSDNALYQNVGLEGEYPPGNIIIYKVLTVRDRRDGNPFRSVSVARNNKSSDWKIINSGY
ncbi:MAG: hypothetical protein LUE86_02685 [Clostridiales bacterium]|nr:hypothetical protein [Clostridiales bacterium]